MPPATSTHRFGDGGGDGCRDADGFGQLRPGGRTGERRADGFGDGGTGDGTEDTAYTVTLADLLAGFSDVDGDELSVTGLTASNGTAVENEDRSWTITPSANFNGQVTLSYSVTDSTATVAGSLSYESGTGERRPHGCGDGGAGGWHRGYGLFRDGWPTCWRASRMSTAMSCR